MLYNSIHWIVECCVAHSFLHFLVSVARQINHLKVIFLIFIGFIFSESYSFFVFYFSLFDDYKTTRILHLMEMHKQNNHKYWKYMGILLLFQYRSCWMLFVMFFLRKKKHGTHCRDKKKQIMINLACLFM